MMGWLDHIPGWVVKRPGLSLIVTLVVAVSFGAFAPFVGTVDNVDYFTPKDHPDTVFYEEFKRIFGGDEFFIIAFQKPDLFTSENLALIQELTEKLEALDGVREVLSLANANETEGGDGFFAVRRFLDSVPQSREALAERRQKALANPLYVRWLLSQDGTTAAIIVFPEDRPDDPGLRARLLSQTEAILEAYRRQGTAFHMAGWTVVNVSLSRYMKDDVRRFIPITYALIALTVHWVFGRFLLTLLALANISACLAASMGFFRVAGISLNNVTVIVPPLIMALSLSDTVHIFSHLDTAVLRSVGGDRRKALETVLSLVVRPSFLTTLTTFVGFLSLAVSPIPPIRDFAWTASMGMVFEFFFAFAFLPPLLLAIPPEKIYRDPKEQRHLTSVLETLCQIATGRPRPIVAGCTVLMVLGTVLAFRIPVETNLLDYFKKSDRLRRSADFVERNLAGVGSFEVSIEAGKEDAFKDPRLLKAVDRLQFEIQKLPGVDATLSLVDFVKDMHRSFHAKDPNPSPFPESRDLVAQYLLLYDAKDVDRFVTPSYNRMRITVRLSEHRSSKQAVLLDRVAALAAETLPEELTVRLTGRAVQDVDLVDALVGGQLQSLALAAGVIWLIMVAALRSWALGLLSLPPNLFPIALNFGLMGLWSIPLNTATALIAAVAVGMAVDNTIHFLILYAQNRATGLNREASVGAVIVTKGRAMVSSSAILVIGFGALIFSRFVPTVQFGFLSAVIMISALGGDVIFLPSTFLCAKAPREQALPTAPKKQTFLTPKPFEGKTP